MRSSKHAQFWFGDVHEQKKRVSMMIMSKVASNGGYMWAGQKCLLKLFYAKWIVSRKKNKKKLAYGGFFQDGPT